jgi:hypothetical protein
LQRGRDRTLLLIIALILGYRSAKKARTLTATPINIGEITTGPRPSLGPGSAVDPLAELDTEAFGNLFCERKVGPTGDDMQPLLGDEFHSVSFAGFLIGHSDDEV